jgi:hypothetical protein
MNFITLIQSLLPVASQFVPNAGQITPLALAAANLIAFINQQKGKTTQQLLTHAESILDENEIELLKDLVRLQGAPPPPSPGPSTGGGSGGSGGGSSPGSPSGIGGSR